MKNAVKIIGILFILWGCAAITKSIYFGRYEQILWACWIGLIISGIGMIRRNISLVGSQLNILAIPWLVWSIDFLYVLITGDTWLGITNYVFDDIPLIDTIITMAHLFVLPLSLYAYYKLPLTSKNAWKLSIVHLALLFTLTVSLTNYTPDNKINCIYNACIPLPSVAPQPAQWIVLATALTLATHFMLISTHSLLRKKSLQKSK